MKNFKKAVALLTALTTVMAFSIPAAFAEEEAVDIDEEIVEIEAAAVEEEFDEAVETEEAAEVEIEEIEATEVEVFDTDTLPEAVSGVITLTENVTLSANWTLGEDTVIDLAGFTLDLGENYVDVANYSFTVNDDSGAGVIKSSGTKTVTVSGGSVTINGGTVSNEYASADTLTERNNYFYCIYAEGSSSIEINGGAVSVENNCSVTCNATAATALYAYAVYAVGGSVTVDGGSVYSDNSAAVTQSNNKIVRAYSYGIYGSGADVTVESGSVAAEGSPSITTTSNTKVLCPYGIYTENGGSVTVNGGAVSAVGDENYPNTAYGVYNIAGEITINGGLVDVISYKGAYGLYGVSAEIVINDGTVSVAGKNESNTSDVAAVYSNTGSTTINGGEISATAPAGSVMGVQTYNPPTTLTVNGGEISAESTGTSAAYGIQVNGGYSTEITITGGTVSAKTGGKAYGVYIQNNYYDDANELDVNISGGDVTAETSSDSSSAMSAALYFVGATNSTDAVIAATVSGGLFTAESTGTASAAAIAANLVSGNSNVDVTALGGTYSSDITDSSVTYGCVTIADNYYQTDVSGAYTVTQSSTTVNDTHSGANYTVTLNNLYSELVSAATIDVTEEATVEVVTETVDADSVPEPSATPEATATSTFAVDISIIKTNSDGTTENISSSVTSQSVTVILPEEPNDDGVTVYHVNSNNESEKIETEVTISGAAVTFTAPSFSTYWFAYEPKSFSETDITDTITLSLEPVTANVSDGQYYLKLTPASGKVIYGFTSTQLKFEFTDDSVIDNIANLSITPNTGINIVDKGDGEYAIYCDGKTYSSLSCAAGSSITLGTVNIVGIGYFEVSLDDSFTNQVHTTKYSNNIVDTYVLGASTSGVLEASDPLASDTLSLETVRLTINVMFPNSVEDEQGADYTDMTVAVSGIGVDEEIAFGDGSQVSLTASNADGGDDVTANGYSTYLNVYKGYAYTLEFTGAGYRTYRTSIVPTGTASVTVWNNAMDSEDTIVTKGGDEQVTEDVTFLAGDILMDYTINLYDLSAVTSYFGKTGSLTDMQDYVSYDLNRDGKIDSKDIAMVLVSWNK